MKRFTGFFFESDSENISFLFVTRIWQRTVCYLFMFLTTFCQSQPDHRVTCTKINLCHKKKRRKKDKITNQKESLTRFLFFLRRELERKLREDCWMAPHRQKKLVANWRPGEHNYFTPVYVCVLVRRWKEMEGFNWWYFETEIHL